MMLTAVYYCIICPVSLCQLLSGYGMGTPYTWGMAKEWARTLARNTFWTWGQKNIHGIYINKTKVESVQLEKTLKFIFWPNFFLAFCHNSLAEI